VTSELRAPALAVRGVNGKDSLSDLEGGVTGVVTTQRGCPQQNALDLARTTPRSISTSVSRLGPSMTLSEDYGAQASNCIAGSMWKAGSEHGRKRSFISTELHDASVPDPLGRFIDGTNATRCVGRYKRGRCCHCIARLAMPRRLQTYRPRNMRPAYDRWGFL
jgi:hypothetical protein